MLDFEPQSPSVTGNVCYVYNAWRVCLKEIPEEKHLNLSDYLNQI